MATAPLNAALCGLVETMPWSVDTIIWALFVMVGLFFAFRVWRYGLSGWASRSTVERTIGEFQSGNMEYKVHVMSGHSGERAVALEFLASRPSEPHVWSVLSVPETRRLVLLLGNAASANIARTVGKVQGEWHGGLRTTLTIRSLVRPPGDRSVALRLIAWSWLSFEILPFNMPPFEAQRLGSILQDAAD